MKEIKDLSKVKMDSILVDGDREVHYQVLDKTGSRLILRPDPYYHPSDWYYCEIDMKTWEFYFEQQDTPAYQMTRLFEILEADRDYD